MSHKWRVWLSAVVVVLVLVSFPAVALAAGTDVGKNVAELLKGYASELYGGIVAVASLMFLVNRRYTELALFLFAAVVVAWMIFASSDIATAAEAIAKQVFG
jgi:peptidoglycan/LPS O-acetylase OafA/YrhL